MSDVNYEDILDAFEEEKPLIIADKGVRLANFIVDYIIVYVFMNVVGIFLGLFMYMLQDLRIISEELIMVILYIFLFSFYILYYAASEYFFNGKTLAKFITRTRVVKPDGSHPTFLNLVGRSAARFIPFEPFSFLGSKPTGWHDTMCNTIVIRD